MPYSIVIELYNNELISEKNLNSRILYALVLNIIQSSDPELSKYFHDEEFNKSMTLRKLYYKNNILGLRLTLLDEKLFDKFGNVMINACMNSYDLNGNELKIAKITSSNETELFWSNYTTYQDIYNNAKKDKSLSFNIVTPLSFKQGDSFLAFPMPDLFFKSIHKKWNKHSGLAFDDIYLDLIEKDVHISFYNLRTEQVRDNLKIAFTGCVGKITFKISNKASDKFIHYLNVLADYAYFSGIGAKTTMGMGQLHRTIIPLTPFEKGRIGESGVKNEV